MKSFVLQKTCRNCGIFFNITDSDRVFYQKIFVPEPTFCPYCRNQRRLAFRNERHLYSRHCDFCKKKTVAVFPSDSPYTVYCNDCWWSDQWDPLSYGREYDFSKSFFHQFHELEKSIPHFSLFQDQSSENCDFINYGVANKSCYLSFSCAWAEHIYYGTYVARSKSCVDCLCCVSCELCYECVDATSCYRLFSSQDCSGCSESYFLKDCKQCSNCFCSVGLRHKKFVFMNQQLTEDEYRKRVADILSNGDLGSWNAKLQHIAQDFPCLYMHGVGNEHVSGDYLHHCKNVFESFDCLEIQDATFCSCSAVQCQDMYDCSFVTNSQLCYDSIAGNAYHRVKFSCYNRSLDNCEYCCYCFNGSNLFGCIGLKHKEFCILNRQYNPSEYASLRDRILYSMQQSGEYGEFFPLSLSPFAYNESVASEYFPLSREEVLRRGGQWNDSPSHSSSIKTDPQVLACSSCGKLFKLISQEMSFYAQLDIPSPHKCQECRYQRRFALRNLRRLWDRPCSNCGVLLRTSYGPNFSTKVYCEKCYLHAVY